MSGIEDIRREFARRLKDFAPDVPAGNDLIWEGESVRVEIGRDEVPVRVLLRLLLVTVLGYMAGDPGDKTRWVVPFRFKGRRCTIADEKFGPSLYIECPPDAPTETTANIQAVADEIVTYLRGAVAKLAALLQPMAQRQIKAGNVTVANNYSRLARQYRYFREKAAIASAAARVVSKATDINDAMAKINSANEARWEASFNSAAMIDSYFSMTEHLFLYCVLFADFQPGKDDIKAFMSGHWAEKYKRVFDINQDPVAAKHYNKLIDIRERFRNPLTHGGYDKRGASIYIHIPTMEPIPANVNAYKDSIEFNLFPVGDSDFDDICGRFDKFEAWLHDEIMPAAVMYAESGLDLPLDEKSRAEMLKAAGDLTQFQEWLEDKSVLADRYYNAEH